MVKLERAATQWRPDILLSVDPKLWDRSQMTLEKMNPNRLFNRLQSAVAAHVEYLKRYMTSAYSLFFSHLE